MAYNILVADDSKTVRAVLSKTLALTGINVGQIITAADGSEALQKLRGNWVDLVLTDLNMPKMTGVELIEAMRNDETLDDIPVIVISTEGSSSRVEDLRKKGVKEYIRKPFTPEVVGDVLKRVLGELDES